MAVLKWFDKIKVHDVHTVGIMGKKGSGKTYLGAAIVNYCADTQFLVFDTLGVYTAKRLIANADYIIIGKYATEDEILRRVKASMRSGRNVVLDVRLYISKELVRLADVIFDMLQRERIKIAALLDEVGDYCSQNQRFYSDEIERTMRHGRNWGVSPFIIMTQRPQKVHKELWAHTDLYFIMRTIHNLDREKVRELFGLDKAEWEELQKELMTFPERHALVFDGEEMERVIVPELRIEAKV